MYMYHHVSCSDIRYIFCNYGNSDMRIIHVHIWGKKQAGLQYTHPHSTTIQWWL